MQTLISVFDDRSGARRAIDRLVEAGFAREDVHLQESGEDHAPDAKEVEAHDRGVLDSLGHFFVSLFGDDRGEKAVGTYGGAVSGGKSLVLVDARDDHEAESAAVILHEAGASEVDDHGFGGSSTHPGVRLYERDTPSLRDLAAQRSVRTESLMADRGGQTGAREMKQDREERAYASTMTHVDRDRPK